jgi:hypothetical protein
MSIMRVVMELTTDREEECIPQDQIKSVEKDGIAELDLLEACWRNFLPEHLSDITIRHLCLILQAYCLIFPYPIQAETSDGAGEAPQEKFIIPCKLPAPFEESSWNVNCVNFYFDFYNRFLPIEIYHKLICLASSNAKPPSGSYNKYSRSRCIFYGLLGTKWWMEVEQDKQRLKIVVM